MIVRPYTLAMEIEGAIKKYNLKLVEIWKLGKERGVQQSLQQYRDIWSLSRLDPKIGQSLDENPMWLKKAIRLAMFEKEIQLELWRAARTYSIERFIRIAQYARKGVRSVAEDAYESIAMDMWPRMAAVVDFGIDSPQHLGSLQHAIRSGVSKYELDMILGDGPEITKTCQQFEDNPYRDVVFVTAWDKMK